MSKDSYGVPIRELSCEILFIHNRYRQMGGEDTAYAVQRDLLLQHGHTVEELLEDNRRIVTINRFSLAARTIWSLPARRALDQFITDHQIELAHFFNTFPLISPSGYSACKDRSIPVVQELQNYRWMCPSGMFFRDGRSCEDCLGKIPPLPGIIHKCYHESRIQTAVVASMITVHRWMRTLEKMVDCFIAPTEFLKSKFIQGGFPREKFFVRPNFTLDDPTGRKNQGDFAIFVGRLSPEKGVGTLLKSWSRLENIPLKILGGGILKSEILSTIHQEGLPNVDLLGEVPREQVVSNLMKARFLVFPSVCYECFPLTIAEAFACGVPVIASRLGAMAEIVQDKVTGLLFNPGDPTDLAAKVRWAWDHPAEMEAMGKNARREYEARYTAEENYPRLMEIYNQAIVNYH